MTKPIRLAVIVGSARKGRFGPVVAAWFTDLVRQRDDFSVDVIDLATVNLPFDLDPTGIDSGDGPDNVAPRLDAADGFVIVTPEYNHSFPAPLKNFIDWHPTQWQAKPIAFVCYGGVSGGLRAVEQLRQVFATLHAVTITETISFHGGQQRFGPDGQPISLEEAEAAKRLLDRLAWWAVSLREAKEKRPFAA